ncbi:MAG TPA: hypothetical protein VFI91_07970, partial [Longimicrobiaceae bacterium]|nr:hypothetical protein [Longimicrobiaceae bacterium]
GVVQVDTVQVDTTVYSYPAVASGSGGFRLGAEWSANDFIVGAALIHLRDGTAVPFGTPFDSALEPLAVDDASGVETYFSVPVVLQGLRLEGAYSRWSDVGSRPYLPVEAGRVALVLHDLYYDGQFEPTLRVEGVRRGSTIVPDVDGNTFTASSPAYNILNLLVQIRIQDVQAYIGWQNVLNNVQAVDLPGLHPRFPRMMYGVSWDFHN